MHGVGGEEKFPYPAMLQQREHFLQHGQGLHVRRDGLPILRGDVGRGEGRDRARVGRRRKRGHGGGEGGAAETMGKRGPGIRGEGEIGRGCGEVGGC